MDNASSSHKGPPYLIIFLVGMGFILGIGAGYLSTLFPPAQAWGPAVGLQSPTSTTTSTAVPPTPTLFLPTLPDAVLGEQDAATPQASPPPSLDKGKPAPAFTLKTLDGKEISLADFAGKPIVINFWATWCPPCRDEMTAIQAAYDKYQSKGLVVLGVNFTAQDTKADVQNFVKGLKLTFPILMDETGDVSSAKYGVHALPLTFFIDSKGIIQHTIFGAMLPVDLESYLSDILQK